MKIGFIGDVVGSPGRDELKKNVKFYKEKFGLDFIVANCENASGGFGISAKNSGEILESGIDAITGGNHSFDKKDIIPLMNELPIIRPYNRSTWARCFKSKKRRQKSKHNKYARNNRLKYS